MNLSKIKEIVLVEVLPDDIKEKLILSAIAKDKNAIKDILTMLEYERELSEEAILDINELFNLLLLVIHELNANNTKKAKTYMRDSDILNKCKQLFEKWKGEKPIGETFNFDRFEKKSKEDNI